MSRTRSLRTVLLSLIAAVGLALTACSSDEGDTSSDGLDHEEASWFRDRVTGRSWSTPTGRRTASSRSPTSESAVWTRSRRSMPGVRGRATNPSRNGAAGMNCSGTHRSSRRRTRVSSSTMRPRWCAPDSSSWRRCPWRTTDPVNGTRSCGQSGSFSRASSR